MTASACQEAEYSLGRGKSAQTHAYHIIIFLVRCFSISLPAPDYTGTSAALGGTEALVGHEEAVLMSQNMSPPSRRCTPCSLQTKELSKWGGSTTREANISPTPWHLWGQAHYPKRQNDYKSVHSSKNTSLFTLQPLLSTGDHYSSLLQK